MLPEVGQVAPAVHLLTVGGQEVSLADFGGQYVILYFYPKDNTPGCTTEAIGFRDFYEELTNLNAVVLGVSTDNLVSHEKFVLKQDLPYRLLADTDKTVSMAYGVYQEKSMYGKKYMGIVRTTFLIDPQGQIAKVYAKVKVATHAKEIVNDLRLLVGTK